MGSDSLYRGHECFTFGAVACGPIDKRVGFGGVAKPREAEQPTMASDGEEMTPSRRVSAIDIADAIDRRIARGGDERAVLGAVVYPLMAEHGVEAVLVELGAAKENPLLASALAYAAGVADVPLTSAFTRDEIVAAALEYLLTIGIPVPEESRLRNDLYGGYRAWFALFDHHPGYAHRRFNDAEHLELVLELIELAPFDDNALYIVGQGPLAHASEAPEQFARIQELAKSDPKIARAWSLKRDR